MTQERKKGKIGVKFTPEETISLKYMHEEKEFEACEFEKMLCSTKGREMPVNCQLYKKPIYLQTRRTE